MHMGVRWLIAKHVILLKYSRIKAKRCSQQESTVEIAVGFRKSWNAENLSQNQLPQPTLHLHSWMYRCTLQSLRRLVYILWRTLFGRYGEDGCDAKRTTDCGMCVWLGTGVPALSWLPGCERNLLCPE